MIIEENNMDIETKLFIIEYVNEFISKWENKMKKEKEKQINWLFGSK